MDQLHNFFTLTLFTLAELLRRKVLHILFFIFFIFCFSLSLWRHFAPETEMQFLVDLGIGLLGVFLLTAAVIIGTDIIPSDIQRRRLLFFYIHPVSKLTYLLGRWLGTVVVLKIAFLVLVTALKLYFVSQKWDIAVSPSIFLFMKYLILLSFLFWLSIVVERFSAVFLGLSFYFFANSLSTLSFLAAESQHPILGFWVKALGLILPHLEYYDSGGSLGSLADPHQMIFLLKLIPYTAAFTALYLLFAYLGLRKKIL